VDLKTPKDAADAIQGVADRHSLPRL